MSYLDANPTRPESLAATAKRNGWLIGRLIFLVGIFVLQFELVEIALRAHFSASNIDGSVWAPFFGLRHYFFSFIIIFPAALALLLWPNREPLWRDLLAASNAHHWLKPLVVQIVCFTCFAGLTYLLSVSLDLQGPYLVIGLTLWACLLAVTVFASANAMAPVPFWSRFLERHITTVLLALALALLATAFYLWLVRLTSALAIATLYTSAVLLSLVQDSIVFEVEERLLGVGDFVVKVSNQCAGYEGIALIAVFLTCYLLLFRREYRFPHVLIAYPLGFAVIWIFNAIRVATLILIGHMGAQDVALAGFHSNAGWIAFLIVCMGLLALLQRISVLKRVRTVDDPVPATVDSAAGAADATLIPIAVLLGSILLVGAVTVDFDTLYPVKVLFTGFALWHFRSHYQFARYRPRIEALLIGLLVFAIWMLLVPKDSNRILLFEEQFSQWPMYMTLIWIIFRVFGSVITVPMAEELAFRGYLLSRSAGLPVKLTGRLPFSLLAFVVSSLLFGALHGSWVAGTLAGAAYGLVRYRSDHIGDAIVSHATTNLLICVYVVATGEWSYW